MTGRPGERTMEINGGSTTSYLARTLVVWLVLFSRSGIREAFLKLPGSTLDHFCLSVDRKRGQRKGATSKNVKHRQKVSKIFSTLFDIF